MVSTEADILGIISSAFCSCNRLGRDSLTGAYTVRVLKDEYVYETARDLLLSLGIIGRLGV